MRPTVTAALLLVLLTAAAPAHAAGVYANPSDEEETVFSVDDRDGGDNDLLITADVRRIVVRERGRDPLVASGECRNRSPQVVVCATEHYDYWEVKPGDGDDRVRFRTTYRELFPEIDGGRGDDTVEVAGDGALVFGGPGRDVLRGGGRDDVLYGGAGRGALHGGAGDDLLDGDNGRGTHTGSVPAPVPPATGDRLDGGRGRDLASWRGSRRPVVVDLARGGRAGQPGERDRLVRIEGAIGGRRGDRLAGDAGPNRLYGGLGRDTLDGRGGNDRLDAGFGNPRTDGGSDREPDRLACGGGRRDGVASPGRQPIPRDCELLTGLGLSMGRGPLHIQPRPAGPGRVRVEVAAPFDNDRAKSRRRVVLRAGGREIGRSRLRRIRRNRVWLTVRLARPLPARGVVRVITKGSNAPTVFGQGTRRIPSRFEYRLRR